LTQSGNRDFRQVVPVSRRLREPRTLTQALTHCDSAELVDAFRGTRGLLAVTAANPTDPNPIRHAYLVLATAGLLFAQGALAATRVACVGTSAELAAALANLSTSTGDSDADEIRIRTGTHVAPAGGFVGAVTTHHDLTISGGWLDVGCIQQALDASLTVLDGNHAAGVLTINTPLIPLSNIAVSGLTFQHGAGGSAFESSAGGLKIGDPNPISGGAIVVERNIFRDNSVTGNGFSQTAGGLLAATDGTPLIVRNNLFTGNTAPNDAALHLESNDAIDVVNNTFSGNRSIDTMRAVRTTFGYFTFVGVHVASNVFWNNTAGAGEFDLDLAAHGPGQHGVTLVNDDIEAPTGSPEAETGTLHVDPGFVGADDFRLAYASPLIDAGRNDAPHGSADLDGAPRVDAASVDIGAYESSYLFVSGFD
jgi:hypothetical protein